MFNKLKKAIAIVLTMAMVLGMSITAWAGGNPGSDGKFGTKDDRGTITVSNVDSGLTVMAHQVVKATYDSDTKQFSGYENIYNDVNYNPATGSTIDQATINAFEKAVGESTNGIPMEEGKDAEGKGTGSYSANVAPGMYLVRITGSETTVYNPMVVSVYYETNGLNEGILNLKDGYAEAKKGGVPTVDKKVDGVDGNSAEKNGEVGDVVTYTVKVSPIPYYGGQYPVLNVVDTLSNGLTYGDGKTAFNGVDVKIIGDDNTELATLVSGTDYTFTHIPGTKTFTVDFVTTDGKYKLNSYAGKTAVITYKAFINENATVNEVANSNEVTLNYSTDSKVEDGEKTDKDKTYTYTFEIDGESTTGIIDKIGNKTGDEEGLNGAKFGLYKENPETSEDPDLTPWKEATTTTISGKAGQMKFSGLEADTTYYLKEIAAPDGYTLNTKVYTVKIKATYYTAETVVTGKEIGELASWVVLVDGKEINPVVENEQEISGVDIMNTTISALPSTGGIGTTIFTIGGCAIMIAAAGIFFVSRKKEEEV